MFITTSTHRVRYALDGFFAVEMVMHPDEGDVSFVVDDVQVARLVRWHDESDDAWANRCTTTRDAVVATCERIVKELPTIAATVVPRVEPHPGIGPIDPQRDGVTVPNDPHRWIPR